MIKSTAVLLDKMSGFDFEELVADILSKLGYGHVEKVLFTQDGGRDILIHSSKGLIVVECKHQPKTNIGRPVVQKLHSAVITSNAIKGILVTTGRFTKEALEYAANLAGSNTPIEMVDRPILIDMASRANVTLISGRQVLSVWSFALPSKEETFHAVSSKLASISYSYPQHPSELLSNIERNVCYRPVYRITYNINSTFETSVGIIHRENVTKGQFLIDGNTGQPYSDNVATFLQPEPQYPFNQPHEDFKGILPTFKIDSTTVQRNAKQFIINKHSRTVSYHGRNNQRYTKECVPGERDIYISDIRQLYLPLTRLDFRLGSTSYYTEGAQAQSGRLLSLTDNFRQCRICNNQIDEDAILCNTCGKMAHSGGFLIRSIHGFKCKRCGCTTCREHGFWRRKYWFFKEMICSVCFESLKEDKVKFRRFEPINTSSLWKNLLS